MISAIALIGAVLVLLVFLAGCVFVLIIVANRADPDMTGRDR